MMIKQVFTSDDHDLVLDKSDCKATVGEHYDIRVDYNKFMDSREGSIDQEQSFAGYWKRATRG